MTYKLKKIINNFIDISKVIDVVSFGNGLINDTYLVKTENERHILRKLNKIFKPSLLEDTEAVTQYIHKNIPITPYLLKTKTEKLSLMVSGDYWRMMNYIPGRCYEKGANSRQILEAAKLLGKFHNLLSIFSYDFKHKISNFHNIDQRILKLKKTANKYRKTDKYRTLASLVSKTLKAYEGLRGNIEYLPDRIIHGDLKMNNIRFSGSGKKAIALLDLDTIGKHKIVIDIGSAVRTWCNPALEDDIKNSKFDIKLFEKIMKGYITTAKFITRKELKAIPEGIEIIILELVARFLTDAFEESYFKFDSKRFPSLYEHNKTRAAAQIVLYEDFISKKNEVRRIINTFVF